MTEEFASENPSIGLKKSRKFYQGAVHENGTGKFEILDRYIEDNIIMLKYKWLSGDLEGDIETNKEVNVNASIWKFKKVRGLTPSQQEKNAPSSMQMHEMYEVLLEKIEENTHHLDEAREFQEERLESYMDKMEEVHNQSNEILSFLKEYVTSQKDAVSRIRELTEQVAEAKQLAQDRSNQIDRLLEAQRVTQTQIDTLIRQNDLASKLIEKM